MKDTPNAPRFDINAAVVFRLGEELITDVVQALVELVKNSYDADASWVKVTIDTHGRDSLGRNYPDARGVIVVEDDGHGMDRATIELGWLTIANSPKREQKIAGKMTQRGRTPTGDKGLGRLGVQRLARNVEIITRPDAKPGTEYYVAFSWEDFRETANLRDVPVTLEESAAGGSRQGTRLILSDLREPETWQGERHVRDLQRKLSGMISPFQEVRDFRVHLEVDGKRLGLAEIAERVRETALVKYTFDFDGEFLCISGTARFKYLHPNKKKDQQLLKDLCQSDRGRELYKFLSSRVRKDRLSDFNLSKRVDWFVESGTRLALDDLDRVRRIDGSAASPGPFRGEVDVVSLDSSDFESHAMDRQTEYRRLVRDLAGIRVYRNGFGIRVGEDWLGLGKQWTGGTSYYGLRPRNVLGYVAISARDNPHLVETTSREGFQVTPHYDNFVGLLDEFVHFAGAFQEHLRRGALAFLNEHRDRSVGVEPGEEHSAITRRIDDVAAKLSKEKRKVQRHEGSLRRAAAVTSATLHAVRTELGLTLVEDESVSSALERLEGEINLVSDAAADADKMLDEVSAARDHASELKSLTEVLDRRWEALNDEVSAFYESISLGLTAEALSHEIHNIADRLARRSAALLREVNNGARKASIVAYIEHVRSSVAAMRKQISHLTPSLRYLRERRERIEILPWAKDLASFYNEKLRTKNIGVVVVQSRASGFAIKMNKGKLTQVFDNLVLNAEYWLSEAIRTGAVNEGKIRICVDAPLVQFMDNGRGIDESVEESLFQPFITTKRRGEGRGLGLFVARQLLDSESCEIILLPNRNARGRRYIFELDLSGAVSG